MSTTAQTVQQMKIYLEMAGYEKAADSIRISERGNVIMSPHAAALLHDYAKDGLDRRAEELESWGGDDDEGWDD